MQELVEERPVPGALVRHRGATIEVHAVERAAPRLEVQRGALWIRATEAGPGILATHGATTVQVREGAAVLEVSDFEALLVVVSGRAAVKGAAALPRSIVAGEAVTLTLDGGFGTPEPLGPEELAADRFVCENLARDHLAAEMPGPADGGPLATASAELSAPPTARVDHAPPPAPAPAEPDRRPPEEPAPPLPMPATEPGRAEAPPAPEPDPAPAEPAEPVEGAAMAAAAREPAVVDASEPTEVVAPRPRDTTAPPPSRKGLLVVVIGLVLLAAVLGALVLGGDDDAGGQGAAPASTASTEAAVPEPEGVLRACSPAGTTWTATGTAQGGGQAVARYEVVVGLQAPDGAVYAEKAQRVVPAADRSTPVEWSTTFNVPAADLVEGSECLLLRVEALRVEPR